MLDFDFLFDNYFFNRWGIKDMHPYKIIEKDGKVVVVLNTAGVSPEDIEIDVIEGDEIGTQYLKINGKTLDKISEKESSISMSFLSRKAIKTIDWESENGLTYLYIGFAEPLKPEVLINHKTNLLSSGKSK